MNIVYEDKFFIKGRGLLYVVHKCDNPGVDILSLKEVTFDSVKYVVRAFERFDRDSTVVGILVSKA